MSRNSLHNLTTKELGQLFPIIIQEYYDKWIELYNADKFKYDREAYTKSKTDFIKKINKLARKYIYSHNFVALSMVFNRGAFRITITAILIVFVFIGLYYLSSSKSFQFFGEISPRINAFSKN